MPVPVLFLGLSALSWAVIGAGVSAVTGAYSMYAQAQAQSRTSAYNALIARRNASLTASQAEMAKKEKGIIEARARSKSEQVLASQRAGYAKAGVQMEGTPLLVAAETISEAEIDALAIRYAGTVEQSQLIATQAGQQQQETLEKMRSKAYNTAGYIGAGSSLITGISDVASIYAKRSK